MVVVRKSLTAPRLNAMKTHCKRGHEFTPENTHWSTNPTHGGRMRGCVKCKRSRAAAKRRERGIPEKKPKVERVRVSRDDLRRLVDVVWNEATESTAVPSTNLADRLIGRAIEAMKVST